VPGLPAKAATDQSPLWAPGAEVDVEYLGGHIESRLLGFCDPRLQLAHGLIMNGPKQPGEPLSGHECCGTRDGRSRISKDSAVIHLSAGWGARSRTQFPAPGNP